MKLTKNMFKLLILCVGLLVIGCVPPHRHHISKDVTIREYKQHGQWSNTSDEWLYWYIVYTTVNGTSTPAYYYSSYTPVSNFATTQFSRVTTGQLPREVEENVEKAELVQEETLPEAEQPDMVQQDIEALESAQDAMTNEGGTASIETESSAASESSSSSDSGSGGDSGGGGSD